MCLLILSWIPYRYNRNQIGIIMVIAGGIDLQNSLKKHNSMSYQNNMYTQFD